MPDESEKSPQNPPQSSGERAGKPEALDADAFRPEAIAERINRLGKETDLERVAREEEEKLLARKREQKKTKKKGLEASASKRLAKIASNAEVKRPKTLTEAAEADPLMERAAKLSKWLRTNSRVMGGLAFAAVIGLAAYGGYVAFQKNKEENATALLSQAINDERGRIGDPEKAKEREAESGFHDPTPIFKTDEERREAALAKYREVTGKFAGTGAAILARLGEGSLLLDKRDVDGALAAFNEVKSSPLAQADAEVRGRAIEGLGFAHELKAHLSAGDKDKELDAAMAAYKDLQGIEFRGFKELAMYHQARTLEDKGDKDGAIALLKELRTKLSAEGSVSAYPYLDTVSQDRLRALDPTALPPKAAMNPGGMDMNNPEIQKLMEQLKRQQGLPVSPPEPK